MADADDNINLGLTLAVLALIAYIGYKIYSASEDVGAALGNLQLPDWLKSVTGKSTTSVQAPDNSGSTITVPADPGYGGYEYFDASGNLHSVDSSGVDTVILTYDGSQQ